MSDWSLENELCECAGIADLPSALVALGLVVSKSAYSTITLDQKWSRSGAETYLLKFTVVDDVGRRNSFAMKAYTPTSMGKGLIERFVEITERRRIIAEAGIITPRLFYAGRAIWLEEWLDQGLVELLESELKSGKSLRHWANELLLIVTTLDKLQFKIENIFSDMRVKDGHIVMLDFGSDLGGANLGDPQQHNIQKLIDWASHQIPTLATELHRALASFVQGVKRIQ